MTHAGTALFATAAALLVAVSPALCARDAPERNLRYRVVETGLELAYPDLQTVLNNRGEIALNVVDANGQRRAAHWRAGRLALLDGGPAESAVSGLNDCGVVSGVSARGQVIWETRRSNRETVLAALPSGSLRQFINATPINNRGEVVVATPCDFGQGSCLSLWRAGELRDLGLAGADRLLLDQSAFHINDRGEVAASAVIRDRPGAVTRRAALVWKDGAYRELELPYPPVQLAIGGLNNKGVAVGMISRGDALESTELLKWRRGASQALPGLPGADPFVLGINDHGDAVGFVLGAQAQIFAALWRDGALIDLNDIAVGLRPAEQIQVATDINEHGWIAAVVVANLQPPGRVVLLLPNRHDRSAESQTPRTACRDPLRPRIELRHERSDMSVAPDEAHESMSESPGPP